MQTTNPKQRVKWSAIEKRREVVLHLYRGCMGREPMSYQEIADILGITRQAAHTIAKPHKQTTPTS